MDKNKGRNNRLVVTLDDRENNCLSRKVSITGVSKSDYVRDLIMGVCPTQAPGKEFFKAYEEMKNRSAEINQIASEAVMRGRFRDKDIDNIDAASLRKFCKHTGIDIPPVCWVWPH